MFPGDFSGFIGELTRETIILAPRVFTALIVFALFFLTANIVQRLVKAAMSRTSTAGHVDFVVARLSYISVLIFGAIAALGMVVNVTALITSLGLAGFAVGFAVKDILGNSLSGILILTQRPFVIGDQIEVEGVEGLVENVRIRDTVILTNEGKLVYVPNSRIFTGIITNNSVKNKRRISCPFKIDLAEQLTEVQKISLKALTGLDGVLVKPEPEAVVINMEAKAAFLEIRFWIDTKKSSPVTVKTEAYLEIKSAIDKAGIKFASE